MKSIIAISEFCDASRNTTGLYFEEMVVGLSKDYDITVLATCFGKMARSSSINCVEIKSFSNIRSSFLRSILISLQSFRYTLNLKKQHDIMILGTNPYWLPLMILYPKWKNLEKLIWCFDFFPENVLSNARYQVLAPLRGIFAHCYRCASQVVVCGRDMRELMATQYNIPRERLTYIANWAPADEKVDVGKLEASAHHIENTQNVLLYFGNLGRFQGIPNLCTQISNVEDHKSKFLFAGSGSHKNHIVELDKNNECVEYLGPVEMSNGSSVYKAAHISIISLSDGMLGTCVPSKLYFSIFHNLPVLCFVDTKSEVAQFCEDYNCGWILDCHDPNALNQFLMNLDSKSITEKVKGIELAKREILGSDKAILEMKRLLSNVYKI